MHRLTLHHVHLPPKNQLLLRFQNGCWGTLLWNVRQIHSASSRSHHRIHPSVQWRKPNSLLLSSVTTLNRNQHHCHSSHSSPFLSSILTQQQLLQRRHYLFFPTSWTEWRLRMKEVRRARIVKVRLWRDRTTGYARETYAKARRRGLYYYQRTKDAASIALSSTRARQGKFRMLLRERGAHMKQRSLEWFHRQRHLWTYKYHRSSRRGALFRLQRRRERVRDFWRRARVRFKDAWVQRVAIPEYSDASWFDQLGRPVTSQDETGRFVNPWMSQSTNGVHGFGTLFKWRWRRFQREWKQYGWGMWWPFSLSPSTQHTSHHSNHPSGQSTAVLPPPLSDSSILRCTWIGHSTLWIQKGDLNILTDPQFSHRCSPIQNAPIGVARDVPPALTIADLPGRIDVCLISHDHYDHLDQTSVQNLKSRVQLWVVPRGLKQWLQDYGGLSERRIVELSWWDSLLLKRQGSKWGVAEKHFLHASQSHGTTTSATTLVHPSFVNPAHAQQFWITAFPTQHWSSRSMLDRCYRLWASFLLCLDHDQTFYFAGDTGLPTQFPLFEQVADYIGRPVDLAALPIGAYAPNFLNHEAHINPQEAVKIHHLLHCRKSMAMHHSTFPLGEEPPHEPAKWLDREAARTRANFCVVPVGGSVSVGGSF